MAERYNPDGVQALGLAVVQKAYEDYVDCVADMMAIEDGLDRHSGVNLLRRYHTIYDSATLAYRYKTQGSAEEAHTVRLSRYYRDKERELKSLTRFFEKGGCDKLTGIVGGGDLIIDEAERLLSLWREDRLSEKSLRRAVAEP